MLPVHIASDILLPKGETSKVATEPLEEPATSKGEGEQPGKRLSSSSSSEKKKKVKTGAGTFNVTTS